MNNHYPYTDLHELNLDYILKKIKELNIRIDDFEAFNQLTYSGLWDITKQYVKWTVVINANDGAYLSIKPVPMGVDISNSEYWVKISDYSALISSLAQPNDNNRKYLFLGDSYYIGGTGAVYTGTGWGEQIKSFLNIPDDRIVLATIDDISPDGIAVLPGFYPSAGTHRSFKTILETIANRLTSEERASITDILVTGGYNDRDQGAAIEAGIADFSSFAHSMFVNAKVWCACIGYAGTSEDRIKLNTVRDYYRNCIKHNMAYINNAEFIMVNDDLILADKIHPTDQAQALIGSSLANGLLYGNTTFGYTMVNRIDNLDVIETGVTTYAGNAYVSITGYNHKVVFFNNLVLIFSARAFGESTPMLLEVECDTLQPTGEYVFNCYLNVNDGGVDKYCMAKMQLQQVGANKYLTITPMGVNYTAASAIKIYANMIEVTANEL